NTRPRRSLAGTQRSGGSQSVVGADSGSASPLAPPSLKEFSFRPPSLPGNSVGPLLRWSPKARQRHGQGFQKTEAAPTAPRLSAAGELERSALRSGLRVRWPLSPASGNPAFVL